MFASRGIWHMHMKDIGGQAVIEGVMMKSRGGWSVAVRGAKGEIHLKKERLSEPSKILKLPIARGVVALYHALSIGIRALEFSASKAYDEIEGGTGQKPLGKASIAVTIAISVLMAVALFILLPLYATKLVGYAIPVVDKSSIAFNIVDGIVRVVIFLLYVYIIGLWGEMGRVFQYHGAEHKVIHAMEHGAPMDVSGVKPYSVRHPRCGTSFLMIVMVISIIVFSMIPQPWPLFYKFLSRVVLIPLIAGVSYEALKLSAKFNDNPVIHMLVIPGLAMQRLTTREPDDSQIEIALVAIKEALAFEDSDGGRR